MLSLRKSFWLWREYCEDAERAERVHVDGREEHDRHVGDVHLLLDLLEQQQDVLQVDSHSDN